MKFYGPIAIFMVWLGSTDMIIINSRGPINPTIALSALFFSLVGYNHKDQNFVHPNETVFTYNHYGRFWWAYIFAPFVAALPAAFLARKHLSIKDI